MDHIRRGAAIALGAYPEKQAVPLLFPLLDDPIYFVREAALQSLQQLLDIYPEAKELFGYDAEADVEERQKHMRTLQQWWKNKDGSSVPEVKTNG